MLNQMEKFGDKINKKSRKLLRRNSRVKTKKNIFKFVLENANLNKQIHRRKRLIQQTLRAFGPLNDYCNIESFSSHYANNMNHLNKMKTKLIVTEFSDYDPIYHGFRTIVKMQEAYKDISSLVYIIKNSYDVFCTQLKMTPSQENFRKILEGCLERTGKESILQQQDSGLNVLFSRLIQDLGSCFHGIRQTFFRFQVIITLMRNNMYNSKIDYSLWKTILYQTLQTQPKTVLINQSIQSAHTIFSDYFDTPEINFPKILINEE